LCKIILHNIFDCLGLVRKANEQGKASYGNLFFTIGFTNLESYTVLVCAKECRGGKSNQENQNSADES
jgi:hypothetical protein